MSPSSLYQMATRACMKNIRSITDVGDAPYQFVRPILLKLENPQQLRNIELASPQICGPDGEIWLEFIKRDVPSWDKKPYEPENPKKWYKAYKMLVMESQKEVETDAAELKAKLDGIKRDQALRKLKEVELKGVKVPEGMKSRGPVISLAKMPQMKDRGTMPPPDRDWKMKDPDAEIPVKVKANKSKLDRFRKEAKAMAHFQPVRRPGIWTPRDLNSRPEPTRRTISVVPSMILEERRKAAVRTPIDPTVKPAPIFAPKRKRVEPIETPKSGVLTNEEREKRLKAFTNPSSATKSTPTQGLSTPPPSDPATPPSKADIPILKTPTLAASPTPKAQANPSVSAPLKRKDRGSPAAGRPAVMKKAPVDVFMPAKRRKIS